MEMFNAHFHSSLAHYHRILLPYVLLLARSV